MEALKNDSDYEQACTRYEQVKYAKSGDADHIEKMQLVKAISDYENDNSDLPEVSQSEFKMIRKEEFGSK